MIGKTQLITAEHEVVKELGGAFALQTALQRRLAIPTLAVHASGHA